MASVEARLQGDAKFDERPVKKQRSPIKFPEDNTESYKKPVESITHQATDLRKQSPSSPSASYIGLHITREQAVTSVISGLLPIPKQCVRSISESWETCNEVTLIISELRADVVLGYAQLNSAPLKRSSMHSSFPTAADICEVAWIKFGEFSKNIFSGMPIVVRSHTPGAVFNVKLGADIVRAMEKCAHQYGLPSPVTVASNWRDIMRPPPPQPSMRPAMAQHGGFGARPSLVHSGGMLDGRRSLKRARHGMVSVRAAEQGGFINRHDAERGEGAPGRQKIPPAILAVLHDAPVMRERPTARKRLVQLSYEEYLDVYGRIEEEWHRRRLEQACINSGLNVKGLR